MFSSPSVLVLVLLLMLSHMCFVTEGAFNHKIIAGGVIDPLTGVDATMMRFKHPVGGCAHPVSGDLFLCDYDVNSAPSSAFNTVFLVNRTTNTITRYAGNGLDQFGSGDGNLATMAGLKPLTCTCDTNGDLYILDNNNYNIRLVNGTTKVISLFLNGGSFFNLPNALAMDSTYIYVADVGGAKIKSVHKETKVVSVIAGGGASYQNNVPATTTQISSPSGIALDSNGNIYFCDKSNHVVRKIANGTVITIAGNQASSCGNTNSNTCGDGGPAINALLYYPMYIHIQENGNIVIMDTGRVRVINPQGIISTLAGTGANGNSYLGGTNGDGQNGTQVLIKTSVTSPYVDSVHGLFGFNNTIYFNDKQAKRYRKIENGYVYHAFGGTATSLYFAKGGRLMTSYFGNSIPSFAFDQNNNMYLSGRSGIYKVINGIVHRIAGSGDNGNYADNVPALNARLGGGNMKIVVNSNSDVYLVDNSNHCVRMYESSTKLIKTIVGTPGSSGTVLTGNGTSVKLNNPSGICLDENENLIIADTNNCLLRLWNKTTQQVTNYISGGCSTTLGGISRLTVYIVAGSGTLCTSTYYTSNKCKDGLADPTQSYISQFVTDLAFHPITQELYWAEYKSGDIGLIRKLDSSNMVQTVVTSGGISSNDGSYSAYGEFSDPLNTPINPQYLSFSNDAKIYFTEGSGRGFVRTIDSQNRVVTVAGHYDYTYNTFYYNGDDLLATDTYLCKPTGVAKASNSEDIYIGLDCGGSTYNSVLFSYSRIVKRDSVTGRIKTVVGNFKDIVSADGLLGYKTSVRPLGHQSGIYYPFGIQVNTLGEVYYSDANNNKIKKLKTDGTVVTVVGSGTACATSTSACGDNGAPLLGQLNKPTGLFVTENATIYISDTFNNKIRKVENNIITTIIGSGTPCANPGAVSCDNSNPLLANLFNPSNVYVTKSGDVYITDSGNSKVRKLSGGVLTVIAGLDFACGGSNCGEDVVPTTAVLNKPMGIFVDESKNDVYISEPVVSTVRKISQTKNKITTVLGNMGYEYFSDLDDAIYFNAPTSIIQTSKGILVADTKNGMIREVSPQCGNGIFGLSCDVSYTCYGIASSNSSVCSSNGNCMANDACVCNSGFEGSQCESFKCNNVLYNDSMVCSGNGVCQSPNICKCSNGYSGANCEILTCFGITMSDPNVCHMHGTCLRYNNCSCFNGWLGQDCDVTSCNGMLSNDSSVCNSHGTCSSLDHCNCSPHWLGDNCQVTSCFSILSNDTNSVCNEHGSCTSFDNCICSASWSGQQCNITSCFGVLSNDSQNACHQHGDCIDFNNCECDLNWFGNECSVTSCFGVASNDSSVCNAHGTCNDFNSCECNSGWFGSNCSVTSCFSVYSNSSPIEVCSGNGICTNPDTCYCNSGYLGLNCNITSCFGILSNNTQNVCNQHGSCVGLNKCECNSNWYGIDCNITSCFGILANESNSVCNGHGNCQATDQCQCDLPNWNGLNCSTPICGGLNGISCSGNGYCKGPHSCECNQDYYGNQCENVKIGCYRNLTNACSNHGTCHATNGTCTCDEGYGGENCALFTCFGHLSNESQLVCYGKGDCIAPNNCSCHQGFTGLECENNVTIPSVVNNTQSNNFTNTTTNSTNNSTSNNETIINNTTIISNNTESNNVTNNSTIYNETVTNNTTLSNNITNSTDITVNNSTSNSSVVNSPNITCAGLPQNSSLVCSGKGVCISTNNCSCIAPYYGDNCELKPTIVSGQNCETTKCADNYYGNTCSVYCIANITCSSHGKCSNIDGSCQCNSDSVLGYWNSNDCSQCQSNYFGEECLTTISSNGRFSNDGKLLELSLMAPQTFVPSNVNCSLLISSNDLTIIQPTSCKWNNKQTGEFIIQIGYSNTLLYGSAININTNVFNKVKTSPSYLPITLLPALNPTKPTAVISTVTKTFSSCDEIRIEGASSYDSYYTISNYQWSILSHPTLDFSAISLNQSSLFFESSTPSGNYTVQLIVKNKFNTQSDAVIYTFLKESITIPQIKISDSEDIQVYVDRVPIYVKQYIVFTECVSNDTLTMSLISINWKQLEGPQTNFVKLSNNDLLINSFTDQTAQRYVFEVSLTFINRSTTNSKIVINTIEPDFGIILYQSNVNSTHVTVNVEMDPVEMISKLTNTAWLSHHAQLKSTSFEIAVANSKTIFLSLSIRNSFADLSITFPEDQTLPVISLLSVSPSKSLVTTSDILTLQIMINVNGKIDGIDSLIEREWKLDDSTLISPYLLTPSDPNRSNLIVIEVSKFVEGTSHTITCKVTSIASKLSTVFSYSFNVALNPKPCYCAISPSTGYALETLFTIDCPNCLTADTSLKVAFMDGKTGLRIPLLEGTTTRISIQLPYTGQTTLPFYVTLTDTRTGSKSETTFKQSVLIPKAASITEVKKKKASWDSFYKTLATGDPRKSVFDYITTTVNAMISALGAGRSLTNRKLNGNCLNGGVYNSFTEMCQCLDGFKKRDCSMTVKEWEESANERSITSQMIFDDFKERNQFEPQNERKLNAQISTMYHLFESFDEVSGEAFEKGFEIFKQQIIDAKKISYLTISQTLSDAMSATLNMFYKSKISVNGAPTLEFDSQVIECLYDIAFVKYRNQLPGTILEFETSLSKLTSTKQYPADLSNKNINQLVHFPPMMSNYLKDVELRKSINVKIRRAIVPIQTNHTIEHLTNGTEITTSIRRSNTIISLEFANQVVVDPDQQPIAYYFQFSKQVNDSSTIQLTEDKKFNKQVEIDSEIVCLSDTSCKIEKVSDSELYICHCIHPSYVTIAEKSINRIDYQSIAPTEASSKKIISVSNNNLAFLAFLTLIPIIACCVALVIYIIIKKMKSNKMPIEKHSLEMQVTV